MDLDKALRLVDDKCDVELSRLKAQYHVAIQQKFVERSARGQLLGNGTAVVVKDELNRLINEKGGQYLWHYGQVLPSVETTDYGALETKLLQHFKAKLDYFYSEACHQLDTARRQVQADPAIHLAHDYESASRGWNADIQIFVAKLKTARMSTQSTVVYNFHGANARVNHNSVDSSVNVVTVSESQLFDDVKKALAALSDHEAKTRLTLELDTLQAQKGKPGRMAAYLKFIEHAANHLTVLSPFLPALAQWAGQ